MSPQYKAGPGAPASSRGRKSRLTAYQRGGLALGEQLVGLKVPVFWAQLDERGGPHRPGWDKIEPDLAEVSAWRPGRALLARMGFRLDGLDSDPRNGGEASLEKLADEMGDDGPDELLRMATPSGGRHIYVVSIKKPVRHPIRKDLPGLDYQGVGSAMFLPPTERKGGRYEILSNNLRNLNGHRPCAALLTAYNRAVTVGSSNSSGTRRPASELRQACKEAGPGEQRGSLLLYVHELERLGYPPDEIVAACEALELENFDPARPWDDKSFRTLLHNPGEVSPDAQPGELDGIDHEAIRPAPSPSGLVRRFSDLPNELTEWLWEVYIAFGELTMLDGEKGQAKSSIGSDVAARASRGRAMPGEPEAVCGPIDVIIFGDENNARQQLEAAGADMPRVWTPGDQLYERRPKTDAERGKRKVRPELELPEGVPLFGKMIAESGARLAVFDPITDFLGEGVKSHEDASVRRAIRPLALELKRHGCAGLAIRHMNKDRTQVAKYRGAGSSAFQNRARVHLVTGEVRPKVWGLSIADTNLTADRDLTLGYEVVDSDVKLDRRGRFVGRVNWLGAESMTANQLTHGPKQKPGPAPRKQDVIAKVLSDMWDEKDPWLASEVRAEIAARLEAAGESAHRETVDKVRDELGIEPVQVFSEEGGMLHWVWTMEPEQYKPRVRPGRKR